MKKYLIIYLIINAKDITKTLSINRMIYAKSFKNAYKQANIDKEIILKQYLEIIKEKEKNDIYVSLIDILNKKI